MSSLCTITILLTSLTIYGQIINGKESDNLNNWSIENSYIEIDPAFILKTPVDFKGQSFNYIKKHYPTKGYPEWGNAKIGTITEYGNVNSKNKASGYWIYKIREGWTPVEGHVENGYKIGEWGYNCA